MPLTPNENLIFATQVERIGVTPDSEQLIKDTTTQGVFVGDGTTAGGRAIDTRVIENVNATYTLDRGDESKVLHFNSGTAFTVTIPTNASVPFPVGLTRIPVLNLGAGDVSLSASVGVTLSSSVTTIGQGESGYIVKLNTDEWFVTKGNVPDAQTLAGLTDVQLTSVSNGEALLYDTASGKWKNASIPASDTTYDLGIPTDTTKIRLTGSDGTTDDVTITAGTGITVTRASGTELTIASTASDTTYSLGSSAAGANATIDLSPSSGSPTSVTIAAGTNMNVSETGSTITLSSDKYTDAEAVSAIEAEAVLALTGAVTLAGDFTVDSTTFKIDTTNNRVGILNTSPETALDIGGTIRQDGATTGLVYASSDGDLLGGRSIVGGTGITVTNADATGGNPTIATTITQYTDALAISAVEGESTLALSGAVTVASTLGVTGATTLGSTVGITGATTVGSTLGVTGNTTIGGTLGVTGNTTLSGGTIISGDLTVDTSTMKIDSTNNRVGIVQATPAYPLDVTGDVNFTGVLRKSGTAFSLNDLGDVNAGSPSNAQVLQWNSATSKWVAGADVDTNTTYTVGVPESTTKVRLTGSDSSTSDITVTGGTNVTVTRASATELSISSVPGFSKYTDAEAVAAVEASDLTFSGTVDLADGLTVGSGTPKDMVVDVTNSRTGINVDAPTEALDVLGNFKLSGNAVIGGNLTVNGTTTTVNTQTLSVEDPIILLSKDNAANSVDIGFVGKYVDTSTYYTGLVRDASGGKFRLFTTTEDLSTATVVDPTNAGYANSSLVINDLEAQAITGTTFTGTGAISGASISVTGNASAGGALTVTGDATVGGGATFDSTTLVVDATNNRIGFGTASPTVDIDGTGKTLIVGQVQIGDVGERIGRPVDNELAIFTGGTERLRIDSAGKVGIGTDPTVALDVSGAIKQTSVTDKVFVADANGNLVGVTDGSSGQMLTTDGSGSYSFTTATGTYTDSMAIAAVEGESTLALTGAVTMGSTLGVTGAITGASLTTTGAISGAALTGVGSLTLTHAGSDLFADIIGPVNRNLRFKLRDNGDTDGFVFKNNADTTIMKLERTGHLGIGVTTPAYHVDAGGDINFTGTLRKSGTAFALGDLGTVTLGTPSTGDRLVWTGSAWVNQARPADANTTYTYAVPDTTTKLRLTGSDSSTNDVNITGGTNVTVTRVSGSELSLSSTDTDTTYALSSGTSGSNATIVLTAGGSGSGTSTVTLAGAGGTSISETGDTITVTSTDNDTTYDLTVPASTTAIRLTDGTNDDDITITGGGDTTVTRTSATQLTVSTTKYTDSEAVSAVEGEGTLNLSGITSVASDFKVDTDTLFVDVSTDRVGINDATPSYSLDVTGTGRFTSELMGQSSLGFTSNTYDLGATGSGTDADWFKVATWATTDPEQYDSFQAHIRVNGRGNFPVYYDLVVRGGFNTTAVNGWYYKQCTLYTPQSISNDDTFKVIFNAGDDSGGGTAPQAILYYRRGGGSPGSDWDNRIFTFLSHARTGGTTFTYHNTNVGETTPATDGHSNSAAVDVTVKKFLNDSDSFTLNNDLVISGTNSLFIADSEFRDDGANLKIRGMNQTQYQALGQYGAHLFYSSLGTANATNLSAQINYIGDFETKSSTGTLLFSDRSASRVGVNTNTPSTQLHVYQDSADSVIRVERSSRVQLDILAQNDNALIRTTNDYPLRLGANNTEVLTVTGTSRLGVNTTTPARTLDVNGAAKIGSATNYLDTSNGNIEFVHPATGQNYLDFKDDATDDFDSRIIKYGSSHASSANKLQVWNNTGILELKTNSTDIMLTAGSGVTELNRHTNTANLGPVLSFTAGDSAATTSGHSYAQIAGLIGTNTDTEEDGYLKFSTSLDGTMTEYMRLDESGRLGVGVTNPSSRLHVSSGSGYLKFDTSGSVGSIKSDFNLDLYADDTDGNSASYQNIRFFTAGANERMRVDATGNVGIGTTTPDVKLDIEGTGKLLQLNSGNNSGTYMGIANTRAMVGYASSGLFLQGGYSKHLIFAVNSGTFGSGEVARFDQATGNFGIGTTAPKFPTVLKYTDDRTDPEGSGSSSGAGAIGANAEGGGLYIENASTTTGAWSGASFRTGTADARIAYKLLGTNEGHMSFYLDSGDSTVYVMEEALRLRGGSSGGGQTFNSVDLPVDNARLRIGAGNDLQLFHNGTHSFIQSDTGELKVLGATRILNNDNNKTVLLTTDHATTSHVELYYNDSKKFETLSNGAKVTGRLHVTDSGDSIIVGSNNSDAGIFAYGTGKLVLGNDYNQTDPIDNTYTSLIGIDGDGSWSNIIGLSNHLVMMTQRSGDDIYFKTGTNSSNDGNLTTQMKIEGTGEIDLVSGKLRIAGSAGGAGQVLRMNSGATGIEWGSVSAGSSTTINNNANTRVITGSNTADTLNGESTFTYDSGIAIITGALPELRLIDNAPNTSTARIINNNGNVSIRADSDDLGVGGAILFTTSGSEKMRIQDNGRVGIGTANPGHLLEVAGGGSNGEIVVNRTGGAEIILQAQSATGVIGTNTNHDLAIKTNGTTRMHIEDGGNVGIGNTSPSQKLDVTGNFALSGNAVIGGNLTVNGTTTTVNTDTLSVEDPLILLANGNTANTVDTGFVGKYTDTNNYWTGLVKDSSVGTGAVPMYRLFTTREDLSTATVIDPTATGFSHAELTSGPVTLDYTHATASPGDGKVTLSAHADNDASLRIRTEHGNLEIGPRNSSTMHFFTDRGSYYFDTAMFVDTGNIGSYNEDLSLRTGSTTRMTIDYSTGFVGIGNTSPDSPLHINVSDAAELEWIAELRNTPNPQAPASFGAGIKLALSSGSGNELLKWAGVAAVKSPDLNYSRRVDAAFYTQTDASNGVAPTEKMRISGVGKVGIGLTSPTDYLSIQKNGGIKLGMFNETDGTGFAGSSPPSAHNLGAGASDPGLRIAGRGTNQPGRIQLAQFDANNFMGGTSAFTLGVISFAMNENSNEVTSVAEIQGITSDPHTAGDFDGALKFFTSQGSGSAPNLTEKMILTSDGRLGIGVTAPARPLHVVGDAYVQNGDILLSRGNYYLQDASDGNKRGSFPSAGVWAWENVNVGIGTTSPQSVLHISGGTGDGVLIIEADTDNSGEGDQPYIVFEQDGGTQHSAIGSHSGGDTDNNALIFSNSVGSSGIEAGMIFKTGTSSGYANAVERMRITPTGNVGIGESTPVSELDLGTGALSFATTNTQLKMSGGSNVDLQLGHWGNAHVIIDSDGNDSNRYFSVRHGNATAGSATELFRVQENGNVGIGDTSPDYPLSIKEGAGLAIRTESSGAREKRIYASSSSSPWDEMIYFSKGSTGGWSGQHTFLVSKSAGTAYEALRIRDSGDGVNSLVNVAGKLGIGTGTSAPAYALEVNAGTTVGYGLSVTNMMKDVGGRPNNNLITPHQWTIGSGGVGTFGQNGNTNENERVWGAGPRTDGNGGRQILWGMKNQDSGGGDGGWNTSLVPVDHTKSYRWTVWAKQMNNEGSVYLGLRGYNSGGGNEGVLSSGGTGSANTNPYFWSGDLPVMDKWYLIVGYAQGSGDTTAGSHGTGVYDPVTGKKVLSGTTYALQTTTTHVVHRAYLFYYNTVDSDFDGYFWGPTLQCCDGTETPLASMLNHTGTNSGFFYSKDANTVVTIENDNANANADATLRLVSAHGSDTWTELTENTYGNFSITGGGSTRRKIMQMSDHDTATGNLAFDPDNIGYAVRIGSIGPKNTGVRLTVGDDLGVDYSSDAEMITVGGSSGTKDAGVAFGKDSSNYGVIKMNAGTQSYEPYSMFLSVEGGTAYAKTLLMKGGLSYFGYAATELTVADSQVLIKQNTGQDNTLSLSNTLGSSILFRRDDTSLSGGNTIGQLKFHSNDTNDTNVNARLKVIKDDGAVSYAPMAFTFETGREGNEAERMRITSAGMVHIGDTSPASSITGGAPAQLQISSQTDGQHPSIRLEYYDTAPNPDHYVSGLWKLGDNHMDFGTVDGTNSQIRILTGNTQAIKIWGPDTGDGESKVTFGTLTTEPEYRMLVQSHTASGSSLIQFTNGDTGVGSGDGVLVGLDASENALIEAKDSGKKVKLVAPSGTEITNGASVAGGLATDAITVNSAYSLPTADGSAAQVLSTNGSGTVTFSTIPTQTLTPAKTKPMVYRDSGNVNITQVETTIPFDTEVLDPATNGFLLTGFGEMGIRLYAGGYYRISYSIPINDDGSTGADRTRVWAFLQYADNNVFSNETTVQESYAQVYTREASGGSGLSTSFICQLPANSRIRVRIDAQNNTNISTETNQSQISLEYLGS